MTLSATASARPAPPPPTPSREQRTRRLLRGLSPYAYVAPFFALFAAFGLFPLLYTAYVSLFRVELQTPNTMEWRGLDNYTALFHDEFFWTALRNTFTIGVIS